MASSREYVSRHIYRTPSGQFWDDREGVRVSERRGVSAGKASERNAARFRDDSGRFTVKLFEVKFDASTRGSRFVSVYGRDVSGPQALVPLAYNPNRSATLAAEQARKWLDANEPGFRHFRIDLGDATSGEDEE